MRSACAPISACASRRTAPPKGRRSWRFSRSLIIDEVVAAGLVRARLGHHVGRQVPEGARGGAPARCAVENRGERARHGLHRGAIRDGHRRRGGGGGHCGAETRLSKRAVTKPSRRM